MECFPKGDEKTTQLLKQHLLFHQLISAPRASEIPNPKLLQNLLLQGNPSRHLRGGILSFVASKFYHSVQVIYDLRIRYQVVLIRGHGLSKRYNPSGVYSFPHVPTDS